MPFNRVFNSDYEQQLMNATAVAFFVCSSISVSVWWTRRHRKLRENAQEQNGKIHWFSSSMRVHCTNGALGILPSSKASKRPAMPHSVCNLQDFASVDEWKKSLPRSCKSTLKRMESQLEKHRLHAEYGSTVLDHRHKQVIVDHQRRWQGKINERSLWVAYVLGTLEGLARYFFVSQLMYGQRLLEYYRTGDDDENPRLVAFCALIVKGRTMRSMWFYQRSSVARKQIYFHAIEHAVKLCLQTDPRTIDHLDLGPSGDCSISELKAKYGFVSTLDWNKETYKHCPSPRDSANQSGPDPTISTLCDYTGQFAWAD